MELLTVWLPLATGLVALVVAIQNIMHARQKAELEKLAARLEEGRAELEKRQAENSHRSSLIDDIEQVRIAMKEENGRLSKRVTELERANEILAKANEQLTKRMTELERLNLQLQHDHACLEERLDLERRAFDRTIKEMGRRLRQYENGNKAASGND